MKKSLKVLSAVLTLLLAMCSFAIVPASADTACIGLNIDIMPQAYMDECSVYGLSLKIENNMLLTNGGQSIKYEYTHGSTAIFSNGYWQQGSPSAGFSGIKFWVYNPEESSLLLSFRPNNDGNASVYINRPYYTENLNTGYIAKKNASNIYTGAWGGEHRYGEVNVPAGFKGFVYIPFTSLITPLENYGVYRMDVFNTAGGSGVFYFDDISYYSGDIEANLITDYSADENWYFTSGVSTSTTEQGLKLDIAGAGATACMNSGKSINTAAFDGIKLWIKNTADASVSISPRFELMSLCNQKVCPVDTGNGTVSSVVAGKNMFPADWGNYLADITLPAQFEGYVYIPFASIGNTNDSLDATIGGNLRFDITVNNADNTGVIYIDDICGYKGVVADNVITNFDAFEEAGIVAELAKQNIALSLDTENSYSGKALKFDVSDAEGEKLVWMTNDYWFPRRAVTEDSVGFAFWAKNPGDADILVATRVESHLLSFKNNAVYYLADSNGGTAAKTTNTIFGADYLGEVRIPAGFEGMVYVPFESFFNIPEQIGNTRIDIISVDGTPCTLLIDQYHIYGREVEYDCYGDTNGDYLVNIVDLVRMKRMAAGAYNSSLSADLASNGIIDANDFIEMRKLLLGF